MKTFIVTNPSASVAQPLPDLNTTIGVSQVVDLLATGFSIDKLNESQDLADQLDAGTLTATYNGKTIVSQDPTAAAQAVSGGAVGVNLVSDIAGLDPITLSADTNNLALPPSGKTGYYITLTTAITLTGLAAGTAGDILLFRVKDQDLTLETNDPLSSVGNRFMCPGGGAFKIKQNSFAYLYYDSDGFWYVLSNKP